MQNVRTWGSSRCRVVCLTREPGGCWSCRPPIVQENRNHFTTIDLIALPEQKRRRAPPIRRNKLDIAAIKARRAIHRVFLNWYLARESDLPVKLYLRDRTDRGLNFGFVGITDHLGLYVHADVAALDRRRPGAESEQDRTQDLPDQGI